MPILLLNYHMITCDMITYDIFRQEYVETPEFTFTTYNIHILDRLVKFAQSYNLPLMRYQVTQICRISTLSPLEITQWSTLITCLWS